MTMGMGHEYGPWVWAMGMGHGCVNGHVSMCQCLVSRVGRACLDACAACARMSDAEGLQSWAQRAERHYADSLGTLPSSMT